MDWGRGGSVVLFVMQSRIELGRCSLFAFAFRCLRSQRLTGAVEVDDAASGIFRWQYPYIKTILNASDNTM